MLKLDTVAANELAEKITDIEFDDTKELIIEEVKNKNARVLTSETALGVIKILKDNTDNKIQLFLSVLQGKGGRKFLSELIEFAKQNKIDYVGVQTRRQGALKVLMNRFDFKYLGNRDGFFQLRKGII